jgi:amidophosphoribosyltransferase
MPEDRPPREACGVFGVWAPGEDVAKLTYFGLYALQHRGQESAGIAVSDGTRILVHKEMGLVAQVFDEPSLTTLTGHIAVGHCRYSTTGASVWANAQPTFRATATVSLALGHNGNLINTRELAALLDGGDPGDGGIAATSDTDVLAALFVSDRVPVGDGLGGGVLDGGMLDGGGGLDGGVLDGGGGLDGVLGAAAAVLPLVKGAYSLVFMDEQTLYAARDPHGFRPLVLGRLQAGWVVASETAALDIVGAAFEREIAPGELVAIDSRGVRSVTFAAPRPSGCLFEYVYLARPDTTISGVGVHATRVAVGRRLAAEHPADADLVIPVPESGTPAAIGFAEASGIPFGQGLVKNSYVGRTFIQPSQTIRERGIKLKLNPLRDAIAGRRIVVVDDSIVRGNTQRALVMMLREAGAAEVHVRVASPPVMWPCFYGIDFATRDELIAGHLTPAEICASIGADSLGYVSLAGLTEATRIPASRLCRACFDGQYPVPVVDGDLGDHVLDDCGVGSLPRPGVPVVVPGTSEVVLVLVILVVVVLPVGGIAAARVRTDRQLRTQPIEVGVVALVLELTGDLDLLGLGSAAPHGSTPSNVRSQSGPMISALLAFLRNNTPPPPRTGGARRSPASVQVQPYPLCTRDAYGDHIVPSQIPRSLPTSDIRRSARRSAATDGGTPSESAIASTLAVVVKICWQAARARSKLNPRSSSATWMTPPELTT